ncbi:uncharacterized protein LOC106459651 [Limulus polyphemus]|uniref:Uncharacterized protein LOC106459651 n=1 Tax=Limulus polyphemus TaxID=6850 RepID=A0ABM1SE33_LIMPO|nr:uncharacterized protein LOC106459651 [Limulus polyphemus]XP_022241885.1 uncharacterized protein LOC106459651 [Limulus polyphemus]XP_022241886.1 uncharacterized protein LOC106459651 [Limulus polyphemus]XP_022241887.1 uncharacterized protein LOC106459651 [Limulus polyphemus]XP_022241888.1 uncharacterized protein LOC106459651 [Limulus polyphemus]
MASSCLDLRANGSSYVGTITREEAIQYWRSHRRTKSAGSSTSRDLSLYTSMGLYSHHVNTRMVKTETVIGDFMSHYKITDSSNAITHEVIKLSEKTEHLSLELRGEGDPLERECGILNLRPHCLQPFARIRVFIFLSCVLVTVQQALSSGYFNR